VTLFRQIWLGRDCEVSKSSDSKLWRVSLLILS